MRFESDTTKRINDLKSELESLELSLAWEKRLYVQSMVEQGWTEVHIKGPEYEQLQELWLLFSPNVARELIESARNYRYFSPLEEGIADEDYCDLA